MEGTLAVELRMAEEMSVGTVREKFGRTHISVNKKGKHMETY
jgi:hypothetical protein